MPRQTVRRLQGATGKVVPMEQSIAERQIGVMPYTIEGDDGAIMGVGEFFCASGTYLVVETDLEGEGAGLPYYHFVGANPLKAACSWREISGETVALAAVTGDIA
jgi:hypothetical protein